jgi:hypothetical protein
MLFSLIPEVLRFTLVFLLYDEIAMPSWDSLDNGGDFEFNIGMGLVNNLSYGS